MKVLVVVDMQNDFIDGSLGTKEAQQIVERVADKIKAYEGEIVITTLDTHSDDYMNTKEGKMLPVMHCIKGTEGHKLAKQVIKALDEVESSIKMSIEKPTFGSYELVDTLKNMARFDVKHIDSIELVGLCTDICVVSNALLLKVAFPEVQIMVDSQACAGVTPETHEAALTTMKMCQIEIK